MFKFKLPVFTQTNPIGIWDVSKAKSHRESLGLLPQMFVTPICVDISTRRSSQKPILSPSSRAATYTASIIKPIFTDEKPNLK